MSRIPIPDRLRLAERVQTINGLVEKTKAIEPAKLAPHAATLCALHYEAVGTIARLVELIDRGGNSMLIDKATTAILHWNELVSEARVLVRSG